jgi:hypothetical protein
MLRRDDRTMTVSHPVAFEATVIYLHHWKNRLIAARPIRPRGRSEQAADRTRYAVHDGSSLPGHSPAPQLVGLRPNRNSSKEHKQNYIEVHDTLSIFPAKSFRDANRPNHFLMRA